MDISLQMPPSSAASLPPPRQEQEAAASSPISSPTTPRSQMHIDLSSLPPLITPSPPSNTLLITNLRNPAIFHPASLQTIRSHLSSHAPLFSFSPLKSFRRIVVSYYTTEAAIAARQQLDGTAIMGERCRIYFGEHTPTEAQADRHLAAPKSQKMFFISPPPSPPHDWQVRNEEPPNKEVIADDLVAALAGLEAKARVAEDERKEWETSNMDTTRNSDDGQGAKGRRRGSSTVVYRPELNGASPDLPAVMVENTAFEDEEAERMMEGVEQDGGGGVGKTIMAHTSRPPVELMES